MPSGNNNNIHFILFFATIATTIFVGTTQLFGNLLAGIVYSFSIMTIIVSHEMGHYTQAKSHGIDATLPYFIPFPLALGTMGAVIRFKSSIPNRNALMDTGAAGPLYGFIASMIFLIGGIYIAPVLEKPESAFAGVSLLYYALVHIIKGVDPAYVPLTPFVFAGWLGLFLTMLNLIPIGQLDGGHVTYALFGKSRYYEQGTKIFFKGFLVWGVICFFMYKNLTWLLLAGLIYWLGGKTITHPPLDNEMIDLTGWNRIKGWICVVIFVLTFLPAPFVNVMSTVVGMIAN